MRTEEEIRERLSVYTQALYFSHAHRDELSPESLARHRAVEESIGLLQWCLEPTDRCRLSWGDAARALRQSLGLVAVKAFSWLLWNSASVTPTDSHQPTEDER